MKEKSNPLDLWGFMFIHIMAKELPYFKFEPSEWLEGEIQVCSDDAIVCFINLCSGYWLKLGCISYAFALNKYCRKDTNIIQELINENIITLNDGFISIKFLDKQLKEFKNVSEKRKNAAEKRWNNANALQDISKSNAIREDKIREDKIKKENNIHSAEIIEFSFDDFWSIYPNKTNKKKAKEKFDKLTKVEKEKIEQHLHIFINNPPFKDYTYPHAVTYLNQERFNDEIQLNTINLKSLNNEQFNKFTDAIRQQYPDA